MSLYLVPAGIEAYHHRYQLTVTYKKNKNEKSYFGSKYKRWDLKDKIVELTGAYNHFTNSNKNADICVPVFSASFVNASKIKRVLVNPIHKANFDKSPYNRLNIDCIVDSGGFQLLKGVKEFIDPNDVVARYNKTANIGMPLDLPVRNAMEPYFFDAVSRLIKANDNFILSKLDKTIDLALISHGLTLKRREERLNILDREANVVAIAGLNILPRPGINKYQNIVENLMYVIHRYRKTTKYFHVLGVTSKFWLFIYSLLDVSNYVRSIGADSVSYRLHSLVGDYTLPNLDIIQLDKKTLKHHTVCGCPVCSAVGDIRLLHNYILLESHCLWVAEKQKIFLHDLAREYYKGQRDLQSIYNIIGSRKLSFIEFKEIVSYIELIIGKDKYKPIKSDSIHKPLFSQEKKVDKKEYDRIEGIIRKYEKFYKEKFLTKKKI